MIRGNFPDDDDNESNDCHINLQLQFTHLLIYRQKQFSVNLFLLSSCSNYFDRNFNKFKSSETINFEENEDDPDVSDFIQTFIDICHFKSVKLTDDNVIPLRYLSYIYEANSIKDKTEQYINENHNRLAIRILQFGNQEKKQQFEERIIAKNLIYYIEHNSEDLKAFSINIVYEILQLYYQFEDIEEEEENKIIIFLFECLDHYGLEASILFSFIDFKPSQMKYIKTLINEYKTNFDFNYINKSVCEYVFEQNREINDLKLSNENKTREINILKIEKGVNIKTINVLNVEKTCNKNEIERLNAVILVNQNEINDLNADKNACLKEIKKLEKTNSICNFKINKLKSDNDAKSKEITALKDDNAICNIEIVELKEERDNNQKEIEMLKDDIGICNLEINELKEEKEKNHIEIYSLKSEIETNKNEIEALKNENEAHIKEIHILTAEKDACNDEINRQNDIIEACNKKIYELKSDNEIKNNEINNLKEERKLNKNEIDSLKTNNYAYRKEINTLTDEKESNTNKIERLTIMNEFYNTELNKLTTENKSIKIEINKLKIDNEFNSKTIEKLQKENKTIIKDEDIDLYTPEKTVIYQDENMVTYKLYEKQKISEIINSPNVKGQIIIPKSIVFGSKEYKITKICDKAFSNSLIESLSFYADSDIDTIGESAFENSKLKKLSIPSFLRNLNKRWCCGANELNEIEVNGQNPCFSVEDGILIYQDGIDKEISFVPRNIEGEFLIPEGITRISNYSFSNIQKLNSLKSFTSTLTKIDQYAFYQCENLTNIVFRQDSSLTLDKFCFSNSKNLSSVEIECKEITINDNCFSNCQSLSSFTLQGQQKITIGNDCFNDCMLNNLFILKADNVVLNRNQILSNIKSLQIVVIEAKTSIKLVDNCFAGFDNLISVTLKSDSIIIENNCFMNCSSLSDIIIENASNVILGKSSFINCNKIENIDFSVAKRLKVDDDCFSGINVKTIAFQGETITIGSNCFKNCKLVSSLTIPSTINIELGNNAFEGCNNLQTVIVEAASKLEICEKCFYGLKNLNSIRITGNEVKIGNECFYNCSMINTLTLPNSDKVFLGEKSFEGCNGLINVVITAQTEFQADSNCFYKISKLESAHIISKKVTISNNCFAYCSSMASFTITSADEALFCEKAFDCCKNIEKINVSAIERFKACVFCFNKDYKLRIIKINSKNIFFGGHCFDNCSSLSQVDCPSADEITFFENSFNGSNFDKYLKCPSTTNTMKIQYKPNQNENECEIC